MLPMFTIYERPDDFPQHFVVRLWIVGDGKTAVAPVAGLYDDLRAARGDIPQGMTVIPRALGDDPCIIETWL